MINKIIHKINAYKHNNTEHYYQSWIIETSFYWILIGIFKIQDKTFLARRSVIISNTDVHIYVPQLNHTDSVN